MPYISNIQLQDAVAASMGLGSSASLPAHVLFNINPANLVAYNRMRAVLFDRGFTALQVDAWDEAIDWNTSLGVTMAMWKSSKGDEDRGEAFRREWDLQMKELLTYRIVVGGVLVNPAGDNTVTRVGTGQLDSDQFCVPSLCELREGL